MIRYIFLMVWSLVPFLVAEADELNVYPVPAGAPRSHDYTVRVKTADGKWQQVGCYAWKVDQVTGVSHHTELASVASFDFSGKVQVAVTWNRGNAASWAVRPLSYNIPCRRDGNTVYFSLDRSRYLSVEVNGDRVHNLQLFANPVIPRAKQGKHVIYFGPGYHVLRDSLCVRSGQTVYLAGGAYVKGYISVWHAHDVRIIGSGIVNPERRQEGIMVRYSRNVTINGPLTTQIPVGGSDSVCIANAKVMSWYGWGDGMNIFASRHVDEHHVFCRTSDDCSTVYCTRKGYHGSSRHIRISDAVYWADVAHPIMIGLHGDVEKMEEISDVVYDSVDILQHRERQIDYQGCIGLNSGDNNLVHHITFSNFHIETLEEGMLFNFRVCYNAKYCHAPGRGIGDIVLRNISYTGKKPNLSIIAGYDESRKVRNITFEHLVINGAVIADDMAGKPKWYKTADMADIFVGEHVENLKFIR